MNMIEKVARASFACWRKSMDELGEHLDKGHEFEDMTEQEMKFAFAHARAAIEAMREPTEAMLEAVSSFNDIKHIDQDPSYYWPLMIDAALKENE